MSYDGPDTAVKVMSGILLNFHNEYADLDAQIKAATGDRENAIKSWVESSENPKAVKLREMIAKANEQLRALAEDEVPSNAMSEEEIKVAEASLKAKKDAIKSTRGAIVSTAEATGADVVGVKAWLDSLTDPSHSGRGRKPGSEGSSGPRYSADFLVYGGEIKQDDPMHFSTFGEMSKTCHVADVSKLHTVLASHAGVKVEELSQKVKTQQTWTFVNDHGTEYTVVSTPKARKNAKAPAEVPAPATPVEATV